MIQFLGDSSSDPQFKQLDRNMNARSYSSGVKMKLSDQEALQYIIRAIKNAGHSVDIQNKGQQLFLLLLKLRKKLPRKIREFHQATQQQLLNELRKEGLEIVDLGGDHPALHL